MFITWAKAYFKAEFQEFSNFAENTGTLIFVPLSACPLQDFSVLPKCDGFIVLLEDKL